VERERAREWQMLRVDLNRNFSGMGIVFIAFVSVWP
jgi:hypothetical protein